MNPPDQPFAQRGEPYDGPERRQRIRREEDYYTPPVKHGPFTIWQWAVIGTLVIALALQARTEFINQNVSRNSTRSVTAICVVTGFIENSIIVTEESLEKEPTGPLAETRRESLKRLRPLAKELRETVGTCPPRIPRPTPEP